MRQRLTSLTRIAKEITEEVTGGTPFDIGDIVKHPDGRTVKIVEGEYWGEHGVSNFWRWREVMPNGKLGKIECGYGWVTTKAKGTD
ncbi:MAG: hypothetical protein Q7T57_05645 [Dehalococcoidales bacterium]|nr:hypothetical protein [Dehalococcoidales bacterium]